MNICVIGQQWVDKGKGKVVNVLAEHSDIIVRPEAARRGLRKP